MWRRLWSATFLKTFLVFFLLVLLMRLVVEFWLKDDPVIELGNVLSIGGFSIFLALMFSYSQQKEFLHDLNTEQNENQPLHTTGKYYRQVLAFSLVFSFLLMNLFFLLSHFILSIDAAEVKPLDVYFKYIASSLVMCFVLILLIFLSDRGWSTWKRGKKSN